MNPRTSDDAVPEPLPAPSTTATPQLRRVPVGTPLATPIVRLPEPVAPSTRSVRPLLVGIAVVSVALVVAYAMYARAAKREALEAQFPVVVEGSEAQTIERETVRWTHGKSRLLRALAAFDAPALDSLVGSGACELAGSGLRFTAGADLVDDASVAIDEMLSLARRGRFASIAARDGVIDQLTGRVIVVAGSVSYAFEPATGSLVCAGTGALRAVE
jgi:hypothetical protein